MSGCNGYTNYETWNVALWCDNVEAVYTDKSRRFRDWSACDVESFVKGWFPNGIPYSEDPPTVFFANVNWDELADDWNDELAEELEG